MEGEGAHQVHQEVSMKTFKAFILGGVAPLCSRYIHTERNHINKPDYLSPILIGFVFGVILWLLLHAP